MTTPDSTSQSGQDNRDHNRQYWSFQLAGWTAMLLLSYFSLNIWYTPGEFAPVVHSILQSIAGMLISHGLRAVARYAWDEPVPLRMILNGLGILAASVIWTVWRIFSFTWLTGDTIEMTDWGGWINASIIIFAAWLFCYHALKYYRESMDKARQATEAQNAALRASAKAERANFKRLEAEKLFHETQMRMLKYQLNPHFFLNALNSVSALVHRGDKNGAMDMLASIGDFLRASLANPETVQHTLEDELHALELYLGIEKIRFGDRLQTEFDAEDSALGVMVPSLLLQPIFENAIKFAVSQRSTPTRIKLEASLSDDTLKLRVCDDGPGVSQREGPNEESGQGIGLMNVRQRLESAYGDAFSMELSNASPNGLIVDIEIRTPTAADTATTAEAPA